MNQGLLRRVQWFLDVYEAQVLVDNDEDNQQLEIISGDSRGFVTFKMVKDEEKIDPLKITRLSLSKVIDLKPFKNLKDLQLLDLGLAELPPLPEGLQFLDCRHNPITHLDNLPSSVLRLYCDGHNLTKFPDFDDNLRVLFLPGGNFGKIKRLPSKLIGLGIDTVFVEFCDYTRAVERNAVTDF